MSRIEFELSDGDLDALADRIAARLAALMVARAEPAAYTCATLGAELGISPRAVRAAIGRGDLHAVRRGRVWIIGADAVAAWGAPRARPRRRAEVPANVRTLRDAFEC